MQIYIYKGTLEKLNLLSKRDIKFSSLNLKTSMLLKILFTMEQFMQKGSAKKYLSGVCKVVLQHSYLTISTLSSEKSVQSGLMSLCSLTTRKE